MNKHENSKNTGVIIIVTILVLAIIAAAIYSIYSMRAIANNQETDTPITTTPVSVTVTREPETDNSSQRENESPENTEEVTTAPSESVKVTATTTTVEIDESLLVTPDDTSNAGVKYLALDIDGIELKYGPGADFDSIDARLKPGAEVQFYQGVINAQTNEAWDFIQLGGAKGWVKEAYLYNEPTVPHPTVYSYPGNVTVEKEETDGGVFMYADAGFNMIKLGTIPVGTTLEGYCEAENSSGQIFIFVYWDDRFCWISEDYCSIDRESGMFYND